MNITERMNVFREASRHLWNVFFRQRASQETNWDLSDAFSEVQVALFKALVKFDLDEKAETIPHSWDAKNEMMTSYHIKSAHPIVSALINRDMPPSGYWDFPTKTIDMSKSDVRLISVFNWYLLGFRDNRYYRVRILSSSDSALNGRDALIEADHCEVEYEGSPNKAL